LFSTLASYPHHLLKACGAIPFLSRGFPRPNFPFPMPWRFFFLPVWRRHWILGPFERIQMMKLGSPVSVVRLPTCVVDHRLLFWTKPPPPFPTLPPPPPKTPPNFFPPFSLLCFVDAYGTGIDLPRFFLTSSPSFLLDDVQISLSVSANSKFPTYFPRCFF